MSTKRILVIGGGVGGYPAAIRAARLGAAVTLVERDLLGGTCLNWGCIPTKVMLYATELYETIRAGKTFGLTHCEKIGIDLPRLLKRKQETIDGLTNGVRALCRAKKIALVEGTARFESEREVRILKTDQKIEFDAAIITTGSVPGCPPIEGLEHPDVITNKEAFDLTEPPKKLAIIGGGVIGVEFAQIFHRLGSEVVILEMLEKLLGPEDHEVSEALRINLEKSGITIHSSVRVKNISGDAKKGTLTVHYEEGTAKRHVRADKILLAAGRIPYFEELGLEKVGVAVEKDAIKVNEYMKTNIKGIYAAGDCVGGMMLAHLATAQAEIAVKNALGYSNKINYRAVPRCIYTSPQIAACGLTEEEAKKITDIKVGRFPLTANPKASLLGETYGLIKIIVEKTLDQVLGVMIIGPSATELIGIACLGINLETTAEELADTIFAHPTVSEVFREGAMTLGEGPIHLP